jgi:endonuclease/exonuclease/phosphatase family metal-dependent hydrolase
MTRRRFVTTAMRCLSLPLLGELGGAGSALGFGECRTLRILTWNVFLMPPLSFQSPANCLRAEAIAGELVARDCDILCLQKVFDGAARKVLERGLAGRYPHRYGPANASCSWKLHSGLMVFSKMPLFNYREIAFHNLVHVEFATRKGAMMLTGHLGSQPFQIIATHLQGDDTGPFNPGHQRVRDEEVRQIYSELLAPHMIPDAPLFICGDFCTPRLDPSDRTRESEPYRSMLATFAAENGPEYRITLDDDEARNDLAVDRTGRTDELDYMLVRRNGVSLRTEWTRLILQRPGWHHGDRLRDLSYRYAVEAASTFLRA